MTSTSDHLGLDLAPLAGNLVVAANRERLTPTTGIYGNCVIDHGWACSRGRAPSSIGVSWRHGDEGAVLGEGMTGWPVAITCTSRCS
jgi:hypothetical protein